MRNNLEYEAWKQHVILTNNLFGTSWDKLMGPYRAVVGMIVDDWDDKHFGPYPYVVLTAMQLANMTNQGEHKPATLRSAQGVQLQVMVHNIGGSCWKDLARDHVILNRRAADGLGVRIGDLITIHSDRIGESFEPTRRKEQVGTYPEQLRKIAEVYSGDPIGNNIAEVLDVIADYLDEQATLLNIAREMANCAVSLADWHGWIAAGGTEC